MQVVLDLDETLVCTYDSTSLPEIVQTQAIEAGLNWFELECVSSDKVSLYSSLLCLYFSVQLLLCCCLGRRDLRSVHLPDLTLSLFSFNLYDVL